MFHSGEAPYLGQAIETAQHTGWPVIADEGHANACAEAGRATHHHGLPAQMGRQRVPVGPEVAVSLPQHGDTRAGETGTDLDQYRSAGASLEFDVGGADRYLEGPQYVQREGGDLGIGFGLQEILYGKS